MEIRGDVTDAGQTPEQTTEDRATQPMEAGGWVSQYVQYDIFKLFFSFLFVYS